MAVICKRSRVHGYCTQFSMKPDGVLYSELRPTRSLNKCVNIRSIGRFVQPCRAHNLDHYHNCSLKGRTASFNTARNCSRSTLSQGPCNERQANGVSLFPGMGPRERQSQSTTPVRTNIIIMHYPRRNSTRTVRQNQDATSWGRGGMYSSE